MRQAEPQRRRRRDVSRIVVAFDVPGEAGLASLAQLDRLTLDLRDPGFKPTEEDSIVVLRLSAIYFKSTPQLMELTAELMSKLSREELARCAALTAEFDASVKALEEGCRQRDAAGQLASAQKASSHLAQYLEVAGAGYTVPTVQMPYSSFRP